MPSTAPSVLRLSSPLPGSDRMLRIPGKHRRRPAARPNRPVETSHRHSPIPTGPLYATCACSTFPPSLRTDGQTTPLHNPHRQSPVRRQGRLRQERQSPITAYLPCRTHNDGHTRRKQERNPATKVPLRFRTTPPYFRLPPSLRTDGQTTPLHNLHRQLQSGGWAGSGRSGRAPSPSTSPVERIATATLAGNRKEIPRRKSRSASTLLRPQHSLPFPADDKRQIHKKPPQDSGPAEASVR